MTPTARLYFPVRFAIVAAVLSTVIFFLAIPGWANLWTLLPLTLGAVYFLRPIALEFPPRWAFVVLGPYVATYLYYALQPETQSDALHYHLRIATHQGFPSSLSFYDLIPQGIELLFASAYSIAGERGARLLHLVYLILSVPLIARIGRQLNIDGNASWAAALFYALTPVVGMSATCAYNDAAMVFYVLTVVHLLLERDACPGMLGIAAGFCYAVKFTGGIAAPVAFLFRRSPFVVLGAGVMIAPWLVRSFVLTGNPAAPLLNSIFPNGYFHIESERELASYLRTYGDVDFASIPLQLAVHGDALQGLLGPLWLLAPLGLIALRARAGRILWATAILAGAPWFFNIGARFLMPALPFLALALMCTVPRVLVLSLVFAQGIVSWPQVIPLYASKGAWALGMQSQQQSPERALAKLVIENTTPEARILDLANAPAAITPRYLINAWQTAQGDRVVRSLRTAMIPDRGTLMEWRTQFGPTAFSGIRVRFASDLADSIAIHEIELPGLKPDILWTLRAWPNIWESGLALDGNLTSNWATWQPLRKGMFYEVDFSSSQTLREIAVIGSRPARAAKLELWGHEGTRWRGIAIPQQPSERPALNLRRSAARYLRREGITHVLAPIGADAFGHIAADMRAGPADWDLDVTAEFENVTLYKLRPLP